MFYNPGDWLPRQATQLLKWAKNAKSKSKIEVILIKIYNGFINDCRKIKNELKRFLICWWMIKYKIVENYKVKNWAKNGKFKRKIKVFFNQNIQKFYK